MQILVFIFFYLAIGFAIAWGLFWIGLNASTDKSDIIAERSKLRDQGKGRLYAGFFFLVLTWPYWSVKWLIDLCL